MKAPRLILTILLPMIGGALAGYLFRGGFFGGYNGMVAGLVIGIMAAALLFTFEAMINRRFAIAPVIVGVLAAVFAFGVGRVMFQPPSSVIYGQTFGWEWPDSVKNIRGRAVYANEETAILLRFQIAEDDLPQLLEHRDLQPQPADEPAPDLSPFELPDWWDLDPTHDRLQRYYTVVDYGQGTAGEYENAPEPPEEHTPASEYFARPGQLFYDPQTQTAWYVDRSYWSANEPED